MNRLGVCAAVETGSWFFLPRRLLGTTFCLWLLASTVQAAIILPESLRLAGPLDAFQSEFGDEFFNFPSFFQGSAQPGATHLSGWIEFQFNPPEGNTARFTMTFEAVGTPDGITFPGGQIYTLLDNRAFTNPAFVSRGILHLETGEVTEMEVHAIFQNSVIARVTRNIRIPFGFINDYPPVELPLALPFSQRPPTFSNARFLFDGAGRLTGFEFRGETIAPVTLFPKLGIFPPYSFGDGGRFYFANPTDCVPGTPPQNCPSDETHPDGLLLPNDAFFHPHLDLISESLREVPRSPEPIPCGPVQLAASNGAVSAGGQLFQPGGLGVSGVSRQLLIYDLGANQWEMAAPLPFAVLEAQSATIGSRIYVVGGWSAETGQPTSLVQVYDIASNQWSLATSTLLPVADGVALAAGGRIYVIGGLITDEQGNLLVSRRVQVYDPELNQWNFGPDAPVPVHGSSGAVAGPNLYLINGRLASGEVTRSVWFFNSVDQQWQETTSTPEGVFDAAAAVIDDQIYLFGGRDATGLTPAILQIFHINQGVWRESLEPPVPAASAAAAVLDDRVFVVGGQTQVGLDREPGSLIDVVQTFDPALGWSACSTHPVFTSADVLNAAGAAAAPDKLSPGTRAVILGRHFASSTEQAPLLRFEGGLTTDLPTRLNGIRLWIDGEPAPLFSVSPTRIEFQIPYTVQAGSQESRTVPLEIAKEGSPQQAPPAEIALFAASPGVFIYNFDEYRDLLYLQGATAIARNQDGTLNHPSNPARPEETIILQTSGLGMVFPTPETGERARAFPPHEVALPIEVTIGGIPASVISATLSPKDAGIYDLKVGVPPNTPRANNVAVRITMLETTSNLASISVR